MAGSGQPPASSDTLRTLALGFGILLVLVGALGLAYVALLASSMGGMMSGMMGSGMAAAMLGAAAGPWAIVAVLVVPVASCSSCSAGASSQGFRRLGHPPYSHRTSYSLDS